MRRGIPKKFESLSDAVKQLESEGFTRERAQRAICDALNDRRFLKRLLWAERDTPRGVSSVRNMSVV
jgi:hypothetical protein